MQLLTCHLNGMKLIQISSITELEAQIEMLRETQRKYNGVLRLSGALTQQLAGAAHTQRALGEAFAELAQKSPELQNQSV